MKCSMLRRDLRLFLRGLVPAALLTALLALVCAGAALAVSKGAESVYRPVRAAVVDEENSLFSRMLVSAVSEMDYIAPLLTLDRMDRKEAEAALKEGELAAVIILPAGFVDDITQGRESRGTILLSSAAASQTQVVEAVARCGQLLLAAGQYGVFSGESLLREAGIGGQPYDSFLNRANLALLEEAAGAGQSYFHLTVTDYDGTSLSPAGWYASGWLTLLLFLCSMFFAELYRRDVNRPMLSRLRACGVGSGSFLAGKVALPVVFRWAVMLPLLILSASPLGVGALLSALAAAAAAGVMGGAVMLCLPSGSAVLGGLAAAGLFLCGGIVPRQLLPEAVLTVGRFTPFGAVQGLLHPAWGAAPSALPLLLTLGYTAAALIWTVHRLRRMSGGGDSL